MHTHNTTILPLFNSYITKLTAHIHCKASSITQIQFSLISFGWGKEKKTIAFATDYKRETQCSQNSGEIFLVSQQTAKKMKSFQGEHSTAILARRAQLTLSLTLRKL